MNFLAKRSLAAAVALPDKVEDYMSTLNRKARRAFISDAKRSARADKKTIAKAQAAIGRQVAMSHMMIDSLAPVAMDTEPEET